VDPGLVRDAYGRLIRPLAAGSRAGRLLSSTPAADKLRAVVDHELDASSGEELRTRVGALRLLLVIYLVLTLALLASRDPSPVRWILTAGFFANLALVGVMLMLARRGAYPDLVSVGVGLSTASAALAGCVYLGVASMATASLPMLAFYFGMASERLRRHAVVTFALGGYALLVGLALSGIIPIEGALHRSRPEWYRKPLHVGVQALVILQISAAGYWLARRTANRALLSSRALQRFERQATELRLALREAEAIVDPLAGAAVIGRYTGHTLGPFIAGEVIARSALDEVYEAKQTSTGLPVRLWLMHANRQLTPPDLVRFRQQARLAAELSSEHVPALVDCGSLPDGTAYLATELVLGPDLGTLLRRRGRLADSELDALVEQVCRGLEAAHAAGIAHLAIEPRMLLRVGETEGTWKICGLGTWPLGLGSSPTRAATAVYRAPEQVARDAAGARADVFAFAAVTYRALTGRPAFWGAPSEVLRQAPLEPGRLTTVQADLEAVLALALAKNPEQRLETMQAFASAWRAARRGELSAELRAAAFRLLAASPWSRETGRSEPDLA
jgi:eukaryotic-like serine/threonine-protein kinase